MKGSNQIILICQSWDFIHEKPQIFYQRTSTNDQDSQQSGRVQISLQTNDFLIQKQQIQKVEFMGILVLKQTQRK